MKIRKLYGLLKKIYYEKRKDFFLYFFFLLIPFLLISFHLFLRNIRDNQFDEQGDICRDHVYAHEQIFNFYR